jgi:hypothetical protein
MSLLPERKGPYYYINETPRGFVVACAAHIVSEEVKEHEARALVAALNEEHQKRMQA